MKQNVVNINSIDVYGQLIKPWSFVCFAFLWPGGFFKESGKEVNVCAEGYKSNILATWQDWVTGSRSLWNLGKFAFHHLGFAFVVKGIFARLPLAATAD